VKRRVGGKQAVIHKLLAKPRALYRSLAFLTRFTKVGHEPFREVIFCELSECDLQEFMAVGDVFDSHIWALPQIKSLSENYYGAALAPSQNPVFG
jgi:hypothetical protein